MAGFFSNISAFAGSGWHYSGTLPASFNVGFRARNDEDDCISCERQYSNGQRSMSVSTSSATPTYSLSMSGNFESEQFEGWSTNLLAQSKGTVWHGDVEKVVLVAPNGGIGNEHPIPNAWASTTGYGTTSNSGYASFSQTLALTRPYLNPGEGNCPIFVAPGGARTGHCAFTDAYFQGGATLQATLQGHGSIENTGPARSR